MVIQRKRFRKAMEGSPFRWNAIYNLQRRRRSSTQIRVRLEAREKDRLGDGPASLI
jgi:hypothetical protein